MAPWVRRTLVQAPSNGTTSFAPTFPAAGAGNLLVAVAGTSGATASTPTGWTLGASAVSSTGCYVWWKTAAGGETTFSTTSNGTNLPAAFVIYEFSAGSTFLGGVGNGTLPYSYSNLPALSGISGTFLGMGAIDDCLISGDVAETTTWTDTGAVKDTDVSVLYGSVNGYAFSTMYIPSVSGTFSPAYTSTAGSSAGSKAGITFAINAVTRLANLVETVANSTSVATGTSISCSLSTPAAAGDRLFAIVTSSSSVPAIPSGFSQDATSTNGSQTTSIFSKVINGTEGATFNFSAPTAGAMSVRLLRYTGIGVLNAGAGNGASTSTTATTGALSTTTASTFLIAGVGLSATTLPSADPTWSASFAKVASDTKSSGGATLSELGVATYEASVSGAQSTVATWTPTATTASAIAFAAYTFGTSPLTVYAGADQTIYNGGTASLHAASGGGVGTVTYTWSKVSGPAGTFSSTTAVDTVFTPTGGVGTYNLRLTGTDGTSTISDDVTVLVSATPVSVAPVTVNSSTSWTVTGASTVLSAISDSTNTTYITSAVNPSSQVLDLTMGTLAQPASGQNITFRVECRKNAATSGTITGQLYHGTTLYSTASAGIPDAFGFVDLVFPAADIASVPTASWGDMRIVLSVSAS